MATLLFVVFGPPANAKYYNSVRGRCLLSATATKDQGGAQKGKDIFEALSFLIEPDREEGPKGDEKAYRRSQSNMSR